MHWIYFDFSGAMVVLVSSICWPNCMRSARTTNNSKSTFQWFNRSPRPVWTPPGPTESWPKDWIFAMEWPATRTLFWPGIVKQAIRSRCIGRFSSPNTVWTSMNSSCLAIALCRCTKVWLVRSTFWSTYSNRINRVFQVSKFSDERASFQDLKCHSKFFSLPFSL